MLRRIPDFPEIADMKIKLPSFLFAIVQLLTFGACVRPGDYDRLYKHSVPLMKIEELKSQRSELVLLDSRPEKEFNISHIKGAKCVGYDSFSKEKVEGIAKDQPIVVYCSVGYRSERVGESLQRWGYTKVYNLYGGIFEWVNKGNEVYDANDQVTEDVHAYDRNWGKWLKRGNKVF